jgi:type II secretory ATPase GspE/PulE/Tfp pilus assembly ATPase PilB-like protein/ActR/RegA family two-component response regulator/RNA polymerase subunit RPABC4/transcription elongation factor Spt4
MTAKTEPTMSLQRAIPGRNEIEDGLAVARQKGISPVDHLLQRTGCSEEGLADGFADWLKIPRVKIASLSIDPDAAKAITEKIAIKHQCLPLKVEGSKLVMAMANPADYDAIQDVQFVSGLTVHPVIATRTEILDGIAELYHTDELMQEFLSKVSDSADFSILSEDADKIDLDQADPRNAADQIPVVKMCNLILQEAIRCQASDVHLEPALNCLQVRMRVDGVLREYIDVPKWLHHPLVSRIKILASLDIAERRLPQDGRFKMKLHHKSADVRVSTLPALYGEKVVMRVLGATALPNLQSMEFSDWQLSTLTDCLSQPQGMILLTGPTGSGKTTTLYSMMSRRRSSEINIVTVEDPIEYELPGINQVQVNSRAGLTFAGTLRSILRQDPDVILVGEIRDLETAEVAFQAANTGHLVLSTLHTDDTFGAIIRLLDLGVDRSLISSSLSLIVAQRLARRVCPECKEPYTPSPEVLKKLHLKESDHVFYRGRGCQSCGKTGYAGRVGIYEMLRVTNTMKDLIRQNASESALRRAAAVAGTATLLEDAMSKVRRGVTNPDEVVRIIEVGTEDTFPCSQCNSLVHREFKSCPYCGFILRNACQACGQDLNPEWSLCPYCSTYANAAAKQHATTTEGAAHLLPAPSEDASPRQQLPSVSATEVPAVKRPKILVADDNQDIIKLVLVALRQLPMGVEIFTASDGIQALESIESNKADLVILDVKMPRMDGFAVCEKLRKDLRTAFLPILMLTANGDQEHRTRGYLVGTDDFVSKPFTLPDLVARVSRLLRRTYGV